MAAPYITFRIDGASSPILLSFVQSAEIADTLLSALVEKEISMINNVIGIRICANGNCLINAHMQHMYHYR